MNFFNFLKTLSSTTGGKVAIVAGSVGVVGIATTASLYFLEETGIFRLNEPQIKGAFDLIVQGSEGIEEDTENVTGGRQYTFKPGFNTKGENIYISVEQQSVGGVATVGPIDKPLSGFTSLGEYNTANPVKSHNPARFIIKIANKTNQPTTFSLDKIEKRLYSSEWTVEFVKVIPQGQEGYTGTFSSETGLKLWSETKDNRVIIKEGADLGVLPAGGQIQLEAYVLVGARLGEEDKFYKKRLKAMVAQVNSWRESWDKNSNQQSPKGSKITEDYKYPRLSYFDDQRNTVGLSVFPSLIKRGNKVVIDFDLSTEEFLPDGVGKRPDTLYDQAQLITRAAPSLYAARTILANMNLVKFTKLHDVFYDVSDEIAYVGTEPARTFYSEKCFNRADPKQTTITTTRLIRDSSSISSPLINLKLAKQLKVALDAAFGVSDNLKSMEVTDPASAVYFDGKVVTVRFYHSETEMCGFSEAQQKDYDHSPSLLETVSGYTSNLGNYIIFSLFPRLINGEIDPTKWNNYPFWEEWKTESGSTSAFGKKGAVFYQAGPIGLDMSDINDTQMRVSYNAFRMVLKVAMKALAGEDFAQQYIQELSDFHEEVAEMSPKPAEVLGLLAWPVDSREITTYFGQHYIFGIHHGLDIFANQGDPVYAADDGVVTLVEDQDYKVSRLPSRVAIKHNNGLVTVYLHMSKINVKEGDNIKRGQVIGKVGGTPNTPGAGFYSTGPHLHLEVWDNGESRDPLNYL